MKITVSPKFTIKQLLAELDYIAKQSEDAGYVWFSDYIERPKVKVLLELGWLVDSIDDDGQRNLYIS
tara:strand:+ start:1224 stop:1424 length:201 start_codon:yes stop_codon:yes gene_type:complete